jgi:hypothetical protein
VAALPEREYTAMRNELQKLVCWLMQTTQRAVVIDGMPVYDLRFREDDRPIHLTTGALKYLVRADPWFRSLVLAQVCMVVASTFQQSIYLATGAYFTKFKGWEGRSPLFFASRLVWVAEYRRRAALGRVNAEALRACTSMQLAFLDSVGEEPDWLASFRRNAAAHSNPPSP